MNAEETRLRARIKSWVDALHDKDIARLMTHYAPDIMSFNMMPPLQYEGEAVRANLEGWLAMYEGPLVCEHHDLRITMSGDVAFSTSYDHFTGTHHGGEKSEFWVRATIGYRRIDGEWYAAHEHISMPIDPKTGRVVADLTP